MKAIVTKQNADGTYDQCGMNNKRLYSHYKTVTGLLRYGVIPTWLKEGVKIEIFNSNIYKDVPDRVILMKKDHYRVETKG